MTRDEALKKIKKCLALAKSQNPHEAAAAMRQAQKLMAEHNMDEQDVSMSDVSESKAAAVSQAHVKWESALFYMVAEAFGCQRYIEMGSRWLPSGGWVKHRKVVFVGIGAAADVAAYAYEVLSRQCAKARSDHISKQPGSCKRITKIARGDQFALGWAYGVREMLDKFANSDGNAKLIQSYMDTKHPNMTTVESVDRSVGRNVRENDLQKGFTSGKQAQLQRGVGGMAQQGLLL